MRYDYSRDNIHIYDSHDISKRDFGDCLKDIYIKSSYDGFEVEVFRRSLLSLKTEWAVHNALYALGIERERTGDVDLDYPQPWYMRAAYTIGGLLVWPFIK